MIKFKATKKNKPAKIKNKPSLFFALVFVGLLFVALVFIFLFGWGFINSFKDQYGPHGYYYDKIGFPNPWTFNNYINAFSKLYVEINNCTYYMPEMYFNAVLYSVGCAFFSTLVPCIVAYVVGRYDFKFSKVVYGFVIVTMILPIVGSTPSAIQMARTFGLYDSIPGMWIMASNFLAGIFFLVFYDVYRTLPKAYSEAAEIDGAGHFRTMVKVMLPLTRNTFLTVFLLRLIAYWNEYQATILYMPNHPTIAYGLFVFFFQSDNINSTVPMKLTGSFLIAIPIAIIFFIFKNKIMSNLTTGGIKE